MNIAIHKFKKFFQMSNLGNILHEKLFNTIIIGKKSFISTDVMKIKNVLKNIELILNYTINKE